MATPGKDREGAAAPSPNRPRPGPQALAGLWPGSGRGSAARGETPRALRPIGGRRRPGVAGGHPNSEGERGRKERGREGDLRERKGRGGNWPPSPASGRRRRSWPPARPTERERAGGLVGASRRGKREEGKRKRKKKRKRKRKRKRKERESMMGEELMRERGIK